MLHPLLGQGLTLNGLERVFSQSLKELIPCNIRSSCFQKPAEPVAYRFLLTFQADPKTKYVYLLYGPESLDSLLPIN